MSVPEPSLHPSDSTACETEAELFLSEWKNPSASYRGKPFWSWNGALDKAELLRQMEIFQRMGMGGAFLHSRTGLVTEYLGEEWFKCINACADEAERLGLEAWLYDEDRWPSGSAGGMATENPAFRMKSLRMRRTGPVEPILSGDEQVVAVFRANVEGLHLGSYERATGEETLGEGEVFLTFTTELMQGHTFYNGNTYLDTLRRDATEHFLEITHERYARECGDRLGRSIRGIFTDEPHRGMVFCGNAESRPGEDPTMTIPWTEALFDEFEKRFGGSLLDRLPEVFLRKDGGCLSRVRWEYFELLQQLFLENWAKPCLDWCQRHQMQLTGHVLHEDSLVAQAVPGGSVMRYYEFLDCPGIDILGNDTRKFWVAKQLQSAGRQLGRKWLLSELYGCAGWGLTFEGHRNLGAWQALFGINLRCHHLSWVTMAGEAKRDYPASISFQSGWWKDYHLVEDYFARIHVLLGRGEPVCRVLVLNPVETVWARAVPGWARWLEAADPHLIAHQRHYEDVFRWLQGAGIDFDYGDEEHLARLGSVGPEGDLRLGQMSYHAVVVSGMETLRSTTLARLEAFRQAGGRVVFAGDLPSHVDAEPSEAPTVLAAQCIQVPHEESRLIAELAEFAAVCITRGNGKVFCQVRRDGDALIVAALNTDWEAGLPDVTFGVQAERPDVAEWDCVSASHHRVPATTSRGCVEWQASFAPGEMKIFVLGGPWASKPVGVESPAMLPSCPRVTVDGPFAYSLDEPNVLVLDTPEWKAGSGAWEPAAEILAVDLELRRRLGLPPRAGDMVQPWARIKAGLPTANAAHTPLILRFQWDVKSLPHGPVELLAESPGAFRLSINGKELPTAPDTGWFIDPCLRRIPIPVECLVMGKNVLEAECQFSNDFDLEAFYLIGHFGVFLADGCHAVMDQLPETLMPSDGCGQGLPFYSGCITYDIPRPLGAVGLELGAFGGALARVNDNQPIIWQPWGCALDGGESDTSVRVAIQLTRVNTFGPLHMVPKFQRMIGPPNFRTTGVAFSAAYQLHPSGLLQRPVFATSPSMKSGNHPA